MEKTTLYPRFDRPLARTDNGFQSLAYKGYQAIILDSPVELDGMDWDVIIIDEDHVFYSKLSYFSKYDSYNTVICDIENLDQTSRIDVAIECLSFDPVLRTNVCKIINDYKNGRG